MRLSDLLAIMDQYKSIVIGSWYTGKKLAEYNSISEIENEYKSASVEYIGFSNDQYILYVVVI